MTDISLDKKATYSFVISGDDNVESYRGYSILKDDPNAFQSHEEVDTYISQKFN